MPGMVGVKHGRAQSVEVIENSEVKSELPLRMHFLSECCTAASCVAQLNKVLHLRWHMLWHSVKECANEVQMKLIPLIHGCETYHKSLYCG